MRSLFFCEKINNNDMRFLQYLTENALKQYIKSVQTLLAKQSEDNPQRQYWDWVESQAKPIKIVSYKSDKGLEELVEKFLVVDSPQIKQCHRNSLMIAIANKNKIEVVSGYTTALGGVPVDHTWNFYKPKKLYFDLTGEICLKRPIGKELYMQVIKINASNAFKIMSSSQFNISGFVGTYFSKKVSKK